MSSARLMEGRSGVAGGGHGHRPGDDGRLSGAYFSRGWDQASESTADRLRQLDLEEFVAGSGRNHSREPR
jgi:hypothetical protein